MTTAEGERFFVYRLTRVRGLCVLAVILIHVTVVFNLRHPFDGFAALLIVLNALSRFAVPVFVLLSGFYLSLNARNERPWPFYRRHLPLLVVPYVFYSTVFFGVNAGALGDFRRWFWHLRHGNASDHLWFIPMILGLYLVHPFLRRWYRGSRHQSWFLVAGFLAQTACVLLLAFMGRTSAFDEPIWTARVALSCIRFVGYFLLGYFLRDHATEVATAIERPRLRIAAGACWLASSLVLSWWWATLLLQGSDWASLPHPNLVMDLISPVLSVSAFAVIVASGSSGSTFVAAGRIVSTCGLFAYSVYYAHPLLLTFVRWAMADAGGIASESVAGTVLAFPLTVLLTTVAVKGLARCPGTQYLV